MRQNLILIVVVAIGLSACSKRKKSDLLLGKPVEPSITGRWAGDVSINGALAHVELDVTQDNINVSGSYNATSGQDLSQTLGHNGTTKGATTGPTFALTLQPSDTACTVTVQAGGENDGKNLSFNVTGTDCSNASIRGQGSLTKS